MFHPSCSLLKLKKIVIITQVFTTLWSQTISGHLQLEGFAFRGCNLEFAFLCGRQRGVKF